MFQFIGYSAFAGPDCLNCTPAQIENITKTRITNAIFDHINVTKKTDLEFNTEIPENWEFDTVLNGSLNGNLNAGNVEFELSQIDSIKIKRRKKGEFNWITLKTIPINGNPENINFTVLDRLNAKGVEYEYALVPIMGDVEGSYIISSIISDFNGVFICDMNNMFKFFYDVQYGTNARNQDTNIFKPLGKSYPVVIANGILSYDSGTVSGSILNDDFNKTRVLNPLSITKKKELLKNFLTNKKGKILKDWNGNIFLIMITSSPQITYISNSGMRLPQVQFDWVQIGESNNQLDLYNAGLLDEVN